MPTKSRASRATAEPTAEPAPEAIEADPAEQFRSAVEAALAERDHTTGALPATATDAIAVAFRALRGNARTTVPAQCCAAWMATAADDPANPDVGLMVAVGQVQAALASATVPATRERATIDPVPAALAALDVLSTARQVIFGSLTAEQVDALDQMMSDREAEPVVPAEQVTRVIRCLVRRSGSTGNAGPKAPGRDLPPLIVAAVTEAGGWLTLAGVKRAIGSTGGAVDNRHAKDNVAGVVAVERDGTRGFALA